MINCFKQEKGLPTILSRDARYRPLNIQIVVALGQGGFNDWYILRVITHWAVSAVRLRLLGVAAGESLEELPSFGKKNKLWSG